MKGRERGIGDFLFRREMGVSWDVKTSVHIWKFRSGCDMVKVS